MAVRHGGRGPGHLSRWTAQPGDIKIPWTLNDLGGAMIGLFDAEDASSLELAPGGVLVNSITDTRSGAIFSQSNDDAKPSFIPVGTYGRPLIIADGVDDNLQVTTAPATYPIGSAPLEVWSLSIDLASASDGERWLFSYGGSANTTRRHGRASISNVAQLRTRAGTGSASQQTSIANPEIGAPHIVRSIYAADGTLSVSVDGGAPQSVASTIATTTGRARLFSGDATTPANFYHGAFNIIILIDPSHANWTPENQAGLLAFMQKRIVPADALMSAISGELLMSAISGELLISAEG